MGFGAAKANISTVIIPSRKPKASPSGRKDCVWVNKGSYRFRKGEGTITFTAKGASGPGAAHKIGLIRTGTSPGP